MVLGLWMQRSGVGFRGEVGPNAPMVLGTNNRRPCSAATSRTLCSPKASSHRHLGDLFARNGGILRTGHLGHDQRLTSDVHGSGQGHVCFSHCAEQGAVMKQPGDAVVHHNLPKILVIQDVRINKRACKEQ